MTPRDERDDTDRADRPATASPADGPVGADPRRRYVGLFAVIALLVLAVDITSKALVVAQLPLVPLDRAPKRVLGGLVYLDQARNSGAAFSLGTGFTVVLTVVALAVVLVILRTARRLYSRGWAIALALVLGGAAGNLVDRLFRAPGVGRGRVVDWISVFGPNGERWPIFNAADSAIVCGAVLAAILALSGVEFDGRRTRRDA